MTNKKKQQRLVIPFVGLKEGIHLYEFEIDSAFFEQFEFSIIQKASFTVKVTFEKKPNLFKLSFKLKGEIFSNCDRCNEELSIKAKGDEKLIVKFGDDLYEETEEIKIIPSSEYELDLTKEVYEYIHLLLPSKIVHKKLTDCNQEVISRLNQLNKKEESEVTDPRWSILSKLKNKSD